MKIIAPMCIRISLFLFSCKPDLPEAKVNAVDSLVSRIDSIHNQIADYDSSAIAETATQFYTNYNYITSEMKDTIERETAIKLSRYFSLKKAFNFFNQNYSESKEQVLEEKKQLNDLKQDIENGLVEEKQLDNYLELEKDNLYLIEGRATTLNNAVHSINTMFTEMHPMVDSLITAFKEGKPND